MPLHDIETRLSNHLIYDCGIRPVVVPKLIPRCIEAIRAMALGRTDVKVRFANQVRRRTKAVVEDLRLLHFVDELRGNNGRFKGG